MSDQLPDRAITDLLAAMPVPALLVDQNELILAANAEAESLLGQQITGRLYPTILRQPQLVENVETCLADHRPQSSRYLSNDGAHDTVHEVTCRFVPNLGAGGAGAVLISFRDITDLERTGQMRRDFVANVSHELRTPLTAMIGFIETLQGPARDDEAARQRFLNIMASEAGRMNRLVGDLLSLNRVESEERIRPSKQVDLSAQIRQTLHTLAPVAEKAGTTIDLHMPEAPVQITGDADQLQQVLTNLVENAIKYGNPQGHVKIRLTTSPRDPALRAPGVRIEVSDDGPGIDSFHLSRLTERFYRGDSHRSRELGGTGLGLAIVKHIVNRHRGRLKIESELGNGSVFTVILPV